MSQPDIARTVQTNDLNALAANLDRMEEVEVKLRDVRKATGPYLLDRIGERCSRMERRFVETAVVRLAMSKSQRADFKVGTSGKYTIEKAATIIGNWYKHLYDTYPGLNEMHQELNVTIPGVNDGDAVLCGDQEVYLAPPILTILHNHIGMLRNHIFIL